jgi:signal recognition particle receptor subunit beta
MADFNESWKKLTVKIVYYGPALSGKTTNLICLHDLVQGGGRGDLMSLETKGDRTLYFDLLPLAVTTESRVNILFKLFTVPGQVAHDATRKAVLSRADGVVFVADSKVSQSLNNAESFENLENNCRRVGLDFDTLPLVVQFNKRDLGSIESEESIMELWGPTGVPLVFASALQGKGVLETFKVVVERCYKHLEATLGIEKNYGICETDFLRIAGIK